MYSMELVPQAILLSESTLQLIYEGKICRVVGCYQLLTILEIQKKRRVCRKHHLTNGVVSYHCTICGFIIYDNNRGNRPQSLYDSCIHEAKKLRHREYYARISTMNAGQ